MKKKALAVLLSAAMSLSLVACSNKEMYQVEKTAKKVDPNIFMIVMESNEVHGEGFKVTKVAS